MLYTRLCALLNIEHPILNAPMSGTATGILAAAVSNAGGFRDRRHHRPRPRLAP